MALADPVEAGRLINLIPVGLKEAAIDSPTSRATVQHISDQVDLLERWLEDYLRATNRLVAEHITLENIINNFTTQAVLPTAVSETMLDHDYSVLAMRKFSEGAKDYWLSMVSVIKRLPTLVAEPIRQFQTTELKLFKETRRAVDSNQKHYDALYQKYMSIGRYKEPSSIREDAFQLHEARKLYLRSLMDLFQTTPQFRFKLDKLLVRVSCDSWKEMRQARDNSAGTFQRNAQDMDRVRGWVKEMENCESSFQRELATARKQLEDEAELASRPSRELDDYAAFSVNHLGGHPHTTSTTSASLTKSPTKVTFRKGERSGWLLLRTYYGKPTRAAWIKRWAFVRNGVFGFLVQDGKGGVEESERIGVLLCAVRPAPAEERRFCFELKTNKNNIMLQAETQAELAAWIAAFEAAKEKAVNDPASSDNITPSGQPAADPAFSISAPPIPEFGTNVLASTDPGAVDDPSLTIEKTNTLPVPGLDDGRASFDVSRRGTATDGDRDHASRIMSKLDLHRRTPTTPQMSSTPTLPTPSSGIASLIAATHGSMAVGASLPMLPRDDTPRKPQFTLAIRDMPPSTLAPSTLANTPTPTSLSKAAVVVSGERDIRGSVTGKYGIPNGILANTWGSCNSSFVNRFDRSELRVMSEGKPVLQPSPSLRPAGSPPKMAISPSLRSLGGPSASSADLSLPSPLNRSRASSPTKRHRNTISFDKPRGDRADVELPSYPDYYPLQLKTQDAQFRLLFPNLRRDERLVLVFRATWNPSGQQDFPGRTYITTKEMYFYSNHFGLVLTSGVTLASIDEVTAAPGKDCDFLFVHFKETNLAAPTRITIKTFLEPLRLLQSRLNFLVQNAQAETPQPLQDVIKVLLKMETEPLKRTDSMDSWEDVSPNTPNDTNPNPTRRSRASTLANEFRSQLKIDHGLYSVTDLSAKAFKLPAQPVRYTPPGYTRLALEREFDVSPKALFHVMFGDRSVLWQLLQHERRAQDLKQGPWQPIARTAASTENDTSSSRLYRSFTFTIPTTTLIGTQALSVVHDFQTIDVTTDHLCYAVTDRRTPWHLPFRSSYRLISKIVITHVAKSKCKLAIFTRVDWSSTVPVLRSALERHALHDLDLDAADLADLVGDQVRRLGHIPRTKKAIQIFGQIGLATEVTQLQIDASAHNIEMRRQPRPVTVLTLLMQDIASAAQSWLGTALQGILDIAQWLHKTVSANSFILALLFTSILYNSWFVLKDGWGWYQERNNAKFMRRMGVTPDTVMSKAVYVKDLDVTIASPSYSSGVDGGGNACYTMFHDEFALSDVVAPISSASLTSSLSRTQTATSATKLQKTRQALAMQRHDLLVAMRVVNSIEKEAVQGEYERWVQNEAGRCRVVEPAVLNQTGGKNKTENEVLRSWYDEYCQSCKAEWQRIEEKEKVL